MSKKSSKQIISKRLQKELNESVSLPSSPKAKDFSKAARDLGYSSDLAKNIQTEKAFNRLSNVSKTIRSREAGESIYQNTYGRKGSKKKELTTEKGTKREEDAVKKDLADFLGFNKGKARDNFLKESSKVPLKDLAKKESRKPIEKKAKRGGTQERIEKLSEKQAARNKKKNRKMFDYTTGIMGGKPKTAVERQAIYDTFFSKEEKAFYDLVVKTAEEFNIQNGLPRHHSSGFTYADKLLVLGYTMEESKEYMKTKTRASRSTAKTITSSTGSPP